MTMSFVDVLLLIIALPVILSIIGVLMALREETETYERADYIRLTRSPSQKEVALPPKPTQNYGAFVLALIVVGLFIAYYK